MSRSSWLDDCTATTLRDLCASTAKGMGREGRKRGRKARVGHTTQTLCIGLCHGGWFDGVAPPPPISVSPRYPEDFRGLGWAQRQRIARSRFAVRFCLCLCGNFSPACVRVFQCKRLRLHRGRQAGQQRGGTDGRTRTTYTFRNSSCCDLLRCPSARMLRVPSSPLPPISRQIVARCSFARRTRLLVYRGAKRTYERRLRLFKAHPG